MEFSRGNRTRRAAPVSAASSDDESWSQNRSAKDRNAGESFLRVDAKSRVDGAATLVSGTKLLPRCSARTWLFPRFCELSPLPAGSLHAEPPWPAWRAAPYRSLARRSPTRQDLLRPAKGRRGLPSFRNKKHSPTQTTAADLSAFPLFPRAEALDRFLGKRARSPARNYLNGAALSLSNSSGVSPDADPPGDVGLPFFCRQSSTKSAASQKPSGGRHAERVALVCFDNGEDLPEKIQTGAGSRSRFPWMFSSSLTSRLSLALSLAVSSFFSALSIPLSRLPVSSSLARTWSVRLTGEEAPPVSTEKGHGPDETFQMERSRLGWDSLRKLGPYPEWIVRRYMA